jgi:hypothetical protein
MREKLSIMLDRTFPNTLIEMKKLAAESSRFRTDEVPPRQKDKQRLTHIFRELEVNIMLHNNVNFWNEQEELRHSECNIKLIFLCWW